MSGKSVVIGLLTVLLVLGGVYLVAKRMGRLPLLKNTSNSVTVETSKEEKKSPHFVNSTPSHGQVFVVMPKAIVINTDLDLASNSDISLFQNGTPIEGVTVISDNKLSMRKELKSVAIDGEYTVSYKACWMDNSCNDGEFIFVVDGSQKSSYTDLQGQKQVTVTMRDNRFNPEKIIIDPSTVVVFRNEEQSVHYINTDPHPAHNFFPIQNSSALGYQEEYSVMFDEAGEYPYHCSAHFDDGMQGRIIVE